MIPASARCRHPEYYSQCLQGLIEAAELCLDEGLECPPGMGTEFDVDGLLRMDYGALVGSLKEAVGAGIMAPDEARRKLDLPPTPGGAGPYLQHQNYSLAALAKRDAMENPFAPAAPPPAAPPPAPEPEPGGEQRRALSEVRRLRAVPVRRSLRGAPGEESAP